MSEVNATTTTTVSLPRLNEPAPQFQATATTGPIKLSDFKGKWVVLCSHPADFTPRSSPTSIPGSRRPTG